MSVELLKTALTNLIDTFEFKDLEWGSSPSGGYMKELRHIIPDIGSRSVITGNNPVADLAIKNLELCIKEAKTALEQDTSDQCRKVCEALTSLSSFEVDMDKGAEALFFFICKLRRLAQAALEGRLQVSQTIDAPKPLPAMSELEQLKAIEGMPIHKLEQIIKDA